MTTKPTSPRRKPKQRIAVIGGVRVVLQPIQVKGTLPASLIKRIIREAKAGNPQSKTVK